MILAEWNIPEVSGIEQIPGDTKKKSADFSFIFRGMDKTRKQFLDRLKQFLKTKA
ncbi:MAG: hypothetical protein U9O82_10585 [Thermodesulfobacteriota bacterium]|nr:hypothetical protein [Thermodesulfobacteriota bacterium]